MTDLDELAALAEAATPGEWYVAWGSGSTFGVRTKVETLVPSRRAIAKTVTTRADAAYIAAASPDVVLRLIAVARTAAAYSPRARHDWRCEIRTAEVGWKTGGPPVIDCECGFDRLQAALAALEVLHD